MGTTNFDTVEADAYNRATGEVAQGTQAAAIADVPTGASATAGDNAAAINSILAALRTFGIIAEA